MLNLASGNHREGKVVSSREGPEFLRQGIGWHLWVSESELRAKPGLAEDG